MKKYDWDDIEIAFIVGFLVGMVIISIRVAYAL